MKPDQKKKLVILTGAGISAESGIPTFRGIDGLWEGHRVEDVASPEGWRKDPETVLEFYNQRRKACLTAEPNRGHKILAELEAYFDVVIITQNIDNLHEKAGSNQVLHLHGEIFKAESTADSSLIYDIDGWELKWGDVCEKGAQLRPHIVWFGEQVPMMDKAVRETESADIFVVAGTSLAVYPAAGLIEYAAKNIPKFIIDPNIPPVYGIDNLLPIPEAAGTGTEKLRDMLLKFL